LKGPNRTPFGVLALLEARSNRLISRDWKKKAVLSSHISESESLELVQIPAKTCYKQ
jgi:hypothetical protein